MSYKFNPFTGTLDEVGAGGAATTPGGSDGQIQFNDGGSFGGITGSSVDATGSITLSLAGAESTPPVSFTGSWFTGGTAITTKPQLLIEPTGTTSTSWSTSGTGLGINAPSGFTGNLLDLQVNGSGKFWINNTSIVTGLSLVCDTISPGSAGFFLSSNTIRVNSAGYLGFSGTGQAFATPDVTLYRDAAATLAQRDGTNAQTYRLYNTYTDASNYERGFLQWNSGVFEIGTEGSGTGSEQPVRITAATLNIPNLPTYADNAAATTGGLVAGDVYKTATGELRITV